MTEQHKAVGALWPTTAKSGRKYLSGTIELDGKKHKIALFKNEFSNEANNQPSHRILLREPSRASPTEDDFE